MSEFSVDAWSDISRDERREKLLVARKMLSMARRLQELFPDVARMNREVALDMWAVSKTMRREYRR